MLELTAGLSMLYSVQDANLWHHSVHVRPINLGRICDPLGDLAIIKHVQQKEEHEVEM